MTAIKTTFANGINPFITQPPIKPEHQDDLEKLLITHSTFTSRCVRDRLRISKASANHKIQKWVSLGLIKEVGMVLRSKEYKLTLNQS
jgi:predicted transcriptional regulator